jgi:alpha-1,2-mannosyltransferase
MTDGAAVPGEQLAARQRRRTAWRVAGVGALAVLSLLYASVWVVRPFWHGGFDLSVYRGAMVWWWNGHPLYAYHLGHTPFGFTYPTFAALCMLPMAFVGATVATAITAVGCAVAIVVTTWWLVAPVARRHGWSPWWSTAIAVPLVFAMDPVRETVGYLQVNLFLAVLVLADVLALRRGRRWAGVGIGLATAIKLTPGLFIIYLVITRRWRAAITATATFAAATLVAYLYDPRASGTFWTSALWDTSRVGQTDYTENQSLLGPLARMAWPGDPNRTIWALLAVALLAVGLSRAATAFRRGDEIVGITLTGLTGNLISPISWTHHLYWVVPAVLVLVDVATGTPLHPASRAALRLPPEAAMRAAAVLGAVVAATFLVSLPWFWKDYAASHVHAHGFLGVLGENSYVPLLVLLVLFLPVRSLAARRPDPGPRPEMATVGAD